MWINRLISGKIEKMCQSRPVVLLTGARQTGKSSLLKRIFADAEYVTLDRVMVAEEAEANPTRFLGTFDSTVLLDEIQYAPSLFRELKVLVDENRTDYGRWILTGSQRFHLMKNVGESLAGRIGVLSLETLSAKELRDSGKFSSREIECAVWQGGYPELWANPTLEPDQFFSDYIQTYLERDLKALINISSLRYFQRFMMVCASRAAQLLNYADMAKDVGVSAVTIKSWIGALEAGGIISLLPPFFANIGKRLVKSPMLYFSDTGLLTHLLNIPDAAAFEQSRYRGAIWENFVFSELLKTTEAIPGKTLFFYRDQNGVEIDFIFEQQATLHLIEAKSAERVSSKKLNFSKVEKLFPDRPTRCLLMCGSQESRSIHLKNYSVYNPLLHDLILEE